MNLVLRSARHTVAAATLLALVPADIVLAAPARAATPQAVELDSACEGTESAGFTDTEGTTFELEIDCFATRGFTHGTGDGSTYEPFTVNPRWQTATFIYRVLQSVDDADEAFDLPAPEDQGFTDISTLDEEFQDAINVLVELDVVRGTTATQFDPFGSVRRDQTASFVNRGQGAIQEADDGDPGGFATSETFFPDVDDNVHEVNINGIASVGIVQGRADGRYHAADPVNRGQMAAFVMRWVQVLEDGGFYEDELDNGNLDGVDVVDTNDNGVLDVGDLVGLRFDSGLDQSVGDSVDDAVNLADGDGTVLTLSCGNDRCVQADTALDGSPIPGDGGLLIVRVGDDNLVELGSGDVAGLELDGAVTDVSNGVVSEDGEPLEVADDGVPLEVLDLGDPDQPSAPPGEQPTCDPSADTCTEEPTQEPTEEPTCDPDDCTEQPTDEPTEEPTDEACDPGTEVCVAGTGVVDTNLDGVLDPGDVMQLDLEPNADELLEEGLPDLLSLTDGDGEAVEVACVSGVTRCTEQDGVLYAAVGEDNISEVDIDGVGGLTLDTAELDELRDGNDEPVGILPDGGDIDVLGDGAIPDSTVADLLGELLTTDELRDLVEAGGLLPGLEPELDDTICDLLGGPPCPRGRDGTPQPPACRPGHQGRDVPDIAERVGSHASNSTPPAVC